MNGEDYMQKISRQKTVEGTRIPAIIRNGIFIISIWKSMKMVW
jgi:hypothetical protein